MRGIGREVERGRVSGDADGRMEPKNRFYPKRDWTGEKRITKVAANGEARHGHKSRKTEEL